MPIDGDSCVLLQSWLLGVWSALIFASKRELIIFFGLWFEWIQHSRTHDSLKKKNNDGSWQLAKLKECRLWLFVAFVEGYFVFASQIFSIHGSLFLNNDNFIIVDNDPLCYSIGASFTSWGTIAAPSFRFCIIPCPISLICLQNPKPNSQLSFKITKPRSCYSLLILFAIYVLITALKLPL